jgi:hypothetical protein
MLFASAFGAGDVFETVRNFNVNISKSFDEIFSAIKSNG